MVDVQTSRAVVQRGEFDSLFRLLTGNAPFPWQRALFEALRQGRIPSACDIPTGLGKTAIIPVWLLSLALRARSGTAVGFPRRLIYVVNRRTVVDQATRETEGLRDRLTSPDLADIAASLLSMEASPCDAPLAISTLRGQFADNAEWRNDPARPAVVIGTVDMIGSRLLFGGYGCGFRSRPLHAAFLGQDALLVHDEAHLEPAFQELITAIELEQARSGDPRPLRVMALTATSRGVVEPLRLSLADEKHPVVAKRLHARKGISLHALDDEKKTPDAVAQLALEYKDSGQAILVFLRKVDHVARVEEKLRRAKQQAVQVLTGTLRGRERDRLASDDAVFARFVPSAPRKTTDGTAYLICTSAGEVGVNISADHLVSDLTPFDSMAQRFGRVNRFGEGDAHIDVVHFTEGDTPHARACALTLELLRQLPPRPDGRREASPAALGKLPAAERTRAFTPPPAIPATSTILFDAWALTSIRERLPGRPPVANWLHGLPDSWQPPETHVAWREEVGVLTPELLELIDPSDLLEDYPLKSHELLRDLTTRVVASLEELAERCPAAPTWVVDPEGTVTVRTLERLVERSAGRPLVDLADCTVLLPPSVGGLDRGRLNPAADYEGAAAYDVADEWNGADGERNRARVWDDEQIPARMRLVRTIDTAFAGRDGEDNEDVAPRRVWRWYVRPRAADDDGSRTAREPQELDSHLAAAERAADTLVTRLGLGSSEAAAVKLAARWHDRGKHRACWQRSIRNRNYPARVLAKSDGQMRPLDLNHYRHELGSLIEAGADSELAELSPEVRELALHLIAAHHGRARPHFPAEEAYDPERTEAEADAAVREVPQRFGRLQRRYGRWGLAYLESLVRAADAIASQGREP